MTKMSVQVKAIVEGDIPAHRLLWLYNSPDGETMRLGLPKERGNYVDFVSTRDLFDGEEVTVSIRSDKRIWIVEAATEIAVGANVAADTDGRVGSYTSAPIRIGYALNAGQEGDLIQIVRHPKVYWHNIIDLAQANE